jgi:hypothetical protein
VAGSNLYAVCSSREKAEEYCGILDKKYAKVAFDISERVLDEFFDYV